MIEITKYATIARTNFSNIELIIDPSLSAPPPLNFSFCLAETDVDQNIDRIKKCISYQVMFSQAVLISDQQQVSGPTEKYQSQAVDC